MARILGFDTATADVSVAVTEDGEAVAESLLEGPAEGPPNHASALLPEIERIVTETGGWERVERIAVGVGPGSYTGLRIGVATARALGQGLAKPITPISTLAALGHGLAGLPAAVGRALLPVIDARRSEVFASLIDAGGATRWEPFVSSPEDLGRRLGEQRLTPLAAGSGALRFRRELEEAGAEVLPATDNAHRVAARHLCLLAEQAPGVAPPEVKPVYLRAPDAERWIERDHGEPRL